jgi:glycosyltransferase involved in cell wall biosynthesis
MGLDLAEIENRPMNRVFATIAIPTFNRAAFLRQTLAGLVRQSYPREQFEILVVDNNSRDNTRAVVDAFAGEPVALRYVFESNQGLEHARNRAIAEARGEIIVFADDDILMEPDWLTQIAAPFTADGAGKIGAVGGEVIPVFPDGLPAWVAEWHSPLAFRAESGPLQPAQCPMGANLALRAEIFKKVGVFATGLGRRGKNLFGGDESELLRRVRAAGYDVWFAPAAVVRHQMPASRTTFRYASRHAFDSARSRVIERARAGGAAGYFASRFVANLLKALLFFWAALISAVFLRRDALKKALVRGWRSCGYLYQIPRTLFGKI